MKRPSRPARLATHFLSDDQLRLVVGGDDTTTTTTTTTTSTGMATGKRQHLPG